VLGHHRSVVDLNKVHRGDKPIPPRVSCAYMAHARSPGDKHMCTVPAKPAGIACGATLTTHVNLHPPETHPRHTHPKAHIQ